MRFAARSLLQLALTTLTATTLASAADLMKPNIKPGLWEITNSPQVTGELPIPEDALAKMTPEQRARMEAAMKNYAANTSKPHVYKECMTPEKIAKGFDLARHEDEKACTRKVVSSSANEVTLHDECNKPEGKTVADMHFEVKGGTQTNGNINLVITRPNGKTMTMKSTLQGKWIGADCGSVKDAELEKAH